MTQYQVVNEPAYNVTIGQVLVEWHYMTTADSKTQHIAWHIHCSVGSKLSIIQHVDSLNYENINCHCV